MDIDLRESLKGRLQMKMFPSKCVQVYSEWLKQQSEPILEKKQLKFCNHWFQDWIKEYNICLRKPNKRYALEKEDSVVRLQDYLKNSWMVRKYFFDTYSIDPPIINEDQVPLHRNESVSQKTLFKISISIYKGKLVFERKSDLFHSAL